MGRTFLVMLIAILSFQTAVAREIRRDAIPENFWGTWTPGENTCKEGDTSLVVLSAKAYAGPAGRCAIMYVTEIPGPIYSSRMHCSGSKTQAFINLIIRPDTDGRIFLGANFQTLIAHQRCLSAPAAK